MGRCGASRLRRLVVAFAHGGREAVLKYEHWFNRLNGVVIG